VDYLANHIEALVFCSPKPLQEEDIQNTLREMFDAEVPLEDIVNGLAALEEKYTSDEFSFSVIKSGGGYQFLTKPAYQASIGILLKQQSKKRLSNSALETLAIIAYKQPITKG
jgi:segregation and condensation protein B